MYVEPVVEYPLVHYCSQEKGTGALLIAGEGNWRSTVFRRKKLEHYCSQGEGHWCTTVVKEKETGVLLFSGEENRCSTVLS